MQLMRGGGEEFQIRFRGRNYSDLRCVEKKKKKKRNNKKKNNKIKNKKKLSLNKIKQIA